ncbi:MAG: hypothetical protein EHM64_14515 [Ignavibacteriae bacterium]|nr:MAG: hypothetical protein EHM64_14515 [Ignavibacteriota bacterium]
MRISVIGVLTVFMILCAFAQKAGKITNAEEILAKTVKAVDGVKDFSAVIDAEVNMDRVQIPKMHAELFFKKPDKVHFSSQSFLLVPREGIAFNPATLQAHYLPTSAVRDTVEGKILFKLLLAAKDSQTRLRSLSLWVDPSNWTVTKMETVPYEGRTLAMDFVYELQQEKYWLPSKMVAAFSSESDKRQKEAPQSTENQFDGPQRSLPRNGKVTVVYSNYKINIDLPDSIFEKKKTE